MKIGRDSIFWIVVGGLFLLYALFQLNDFVGFLIVILSLLIAITVHECAHAWTADQLGDPTARYLGRVSLNPIRHLDPVGSVMMVVTAVTGFGIGWGKPVPVSPYRLRYGQFRGNALVALSGPASNLLVALVLGLVLRFGIRFAPDWPMLVFQVINNIVLLNIVIAMFNLIPIPPLDGHSVLLGLLDLTRAQWAWRVSQFILSLQRQGPMILIAVIIISQFLGLNLIGRVILPPTMFFYRLIVG